MRIIISADGNSLDAPASPVFGRCPTYILVDTTTSEFQALANPAMNGSLTPYFGGVLTGLGGTSLEQARRDVSGIVKEKSVKPEETKSINFPFLMADPITGDEGDSPDPDSDIDVPAFMRRKLTKEEHDG